MRLPSLIEVFIPAISMAKVKHTSVGRSGQRTMSDRLDIFSTVKDRITFVFLIRSGQFLRTGYRYRIIAFRAATTVYRIDNIVIAVLLKPVLPFHPPSFIIAQQAERFAFQTQTVGAQFAGQQFDGTLIQSIRLPGYIKLSVIFKDKGIDRLFTEFDDGAIIFKLPCRRVGNSHSDA